MKRLLVSLSPVVLALACSATIDETNGTPPEGTPGTPPGRGPAGAGTPGPMGMTPTAPPGTPAPTTPSPSTPTACRAPGPQAAAAPVRRLTRREYNNTVSALLGTALPSTETNPSRDFVLDGQPRLFENNADSPLTALAASQYADAAERLARGAVMKGLTTLAPCAAGAAEEACARDFVRNFGKRAYRRPLQEPEIERLLGVYKTARTTLAQPHGDGIRLVLQTLLQSPHFLNHVEKGMPAAAGQTGLVPLTQHEVASRLSYFLWSSMPDSMLFAAADAGKLGTAAEVEAQALRMLGASAAKEGMKYFFRKWLDLDRLDRTDKSSSLFKDWASVVKGHLKTETDAFVNDVLWSGDAKLTTLLTAPTAHVNSVLAPLYGMAPPPAPAPPAAGMTAPPEPLVKTALDPAQRAGILTSVTNLSIHAYGDQTSPVHRGLFVREHLLCQHMPSPPPDVDVTAPKVNAMKTTRERFAQHSADPYCAGCHKLIDPIGLGFEAYDALGRWRTTDAGKPVDDVGEIVGSRDLDGKFKGAIELAGKLSKSAAVRDCFASQVLDFAIAAPTEDLACAVEALGVDFEKSGTDVKKLLLAVARSDAFRFRKAISTEACK